MSNLILANNLAPDGFILEMDGQSESEYGSITGALRAGLELKQKFPHSQVKVHDANENAPVGPPEKSDA